MLESYKDIAAEMQGFELFDFIESTEPDLKSKLFETITHLEPYLNYKVDIDRGFAQLSLEQMQSDADAELAARIQNEEE